MSSKKDKIISPSQTPTNDGDSAIDSNALREKSKFLLEEYKALRREIDIYLKEQRSLERYLLIATGAVWGWLLTNHITDRLAWCIPFVLTIAVGVRSLVMVGHFKNLGKYLCKIENQFKVEGWEHREEVPWLSISNAVILAALLIIAWLGYQSRKELMPADGQKTEGATGKKPTPTPSPFPGQVEVPGHHVTP